MDSAECIRISREIVAEAGQQDIISPTNFLDHAELCRDIIKAWPKDKKDNFPNLHAFVEALAKLRAEFADLVTADPMIIYKPAHKVALEFHQSKSRIRYFSSGNRCSKTQTAAADNYWVLTNSHPYRPRPPMPAGVAIVIPSFSDLGAKVYVPKYIKGEGGNTLSPMFPENGAWFYRYQDKEHVLEICCPDCRAAGKPKSCKHPKSRLVIFSAENGPICIAGGQYAQVDFEEQIPEEFLPETLKRLNTVPHSGLIVAETPLGGRGFWTYKRLEVPARNGKKFPGTDTNLVSLHRISQLDAGLTPEAEIRADMESMSAQEIEARVHGRPAAYSKSAVFDTHAISEMIAGAQKPERLCMTVEGEGQTKSQNEILADADENTKILVHPNEEGPLRVWERPMHLCQYVIGADVAQGLVDGDASCAQVLRVEREQMSFRMKLVASYHGWINSLTYAEELFKLSLWYNCAWLVPERRGPGDATVQRLKEMNCWTLFRDVSDQSQAEFNADSRLGVDTNVKTKGIFISILQQALFDRGSGKRALEVYDADTLEELGTYGQEMTPGRTMYRFRGEGGMPDDRVMALSFAVYAAVTGQLYDFELERQRRMEHQMKKRQMDNLSPREKMLWDAVHEQDEERVRQEQWADV